MGIHCCLLKEPGTADLLSPDKSFRAQADFQIRKYHQHPQAKSAVVPDEVDKKCGAIHKSTDRREEHGSHEELGSVFARCLSKERDPSG